MYWIFLTIQEKLIPKATATDRSTLTSKVYLVSLKTKIHNLDLDKLKTVLADLSKRSDTVDDDVFKKTEYNKLSKSMLIIVRYQVLVDKLLKYSMIQTSRVLRGRLGMLKKLYLILVSCSKILNTKQKFTEVQSKVPNLVRPSCYSCSQ